MTETTMAAPVADRAPAIATAMAAIFENAGVREPGNREAGFTGLPSRAEREIVALGLDDNDIALLGAQGFVVLDVVTVQIVGARPVSSADAGGRVARAGPRNLDWAQPPGGGRLQSLLPDRRRRDRGMPPAAVPRRKGDRLAGRPGRADGMLGRGSDRPDRHRHQRRSCGLSKQPARSRRSGLARTGRNPAASTERPSPRFSSDRPESRSPGPAARRDRDCRGRFSPRQVARRAQADVHTLVHAMDLLAAKRRIGDQSQPRRPVQSSAGDDDGTAHRRRHRAGCSGRQCRSRAPNRPIRRPIQMSLPSQAVDGRGNAYRRAGRGAHIDLAAPGVDVWTAASIPRRPSPRRAPPLQRPSSPRPLRWPRGS